MLREPRIKLGQNYIYCNPKAKMNAHKIYRLRLWDYNWPLINYRAYLLQAIRDFQKIYPNIRVDLELLDLITGPRQLEQALKTNNGPDIYCSAYTIPNFNFKKQIPVGPYLKQYEQELYFPAMKRMVTYYGVLCYFPRWIAPQFWIGNRQLIESAGLSVAKIQSSGWSWKDLSLLQKYTAKDKYLLVGNLGENGFIAQLIDSVNLESQTVHDKTNPKIYFMIDFVDTLMRQKAITADCDQNMIGRFLNGQAVLLTGVRPAIYNFIHERLKDSVKWQAVLLPMPIYFAGIRNMPVENFVISIYRNKHTAGDDHLVAAMKLAQFLSNYPSVSLWEYLRVSPASKFAYSQWKPHDEQNQILYDQLIQCPLNNKSKLPSAYRAKVYSILKDLVTRKITGEEAKIKLGSQ
jgi:ABC-type sugar transport system, periplasmic component